jgi:hypothetical protein
MSREMLTNTFHARIMHAFNQTASQLHHHISMQVFKDLINHGLDAVMPAHVVYSQVDLSPAGFSSKWIKEILQEKLGFNGVMNLPLQNHVQGNAYQHISCPHHACL